MANKKKTIQKQKLISVWCEWDIGIADVVFESEASARKYLKEHVDPDSLDGTIDELEEEGLLGFNTITLIKDE